MIINKEKLDGCDQKTLNLVVALENKYGKVLITSGYRDPEYNKKIGGSKTSQHILGKAIDVIIKDVSPIKVAAFVLSNIPDVHGFGIDIYKGYCHFDTREQDYNSYWAYGKNGKVA